LLKASAEKDKDLGAEEHSKNYSSFKKAFSFGGAQNNLSAE